MSTAAEPSGDERGGVRRVATTLLLAAAFALAFLILQNAIVARALSDLPRLTTDFSPAYLSREMASLAADSPATIVLGDSVLWGYGIDPRVGAVALLRGRGCRCVNLAFKGASPPNYYAVLRYALASGVRPKSLLVEIDDKVLNSEDDAYRKLNPSLTADVRSDLDPSDVAVLGVAPAVTTPWTGVDRFLGDVWLPYAMRGDVRETFLGDADAPPPKPTPDLYEGTYDLSPLTSANVGVRYLAKTFALARSHGIPVTAFLTPVNHRLLHDYIDVPAYRANLAYLERLAESYHARVVDLDGAFPASEFLDHAHLTPAGQRRLASVLRSALDGP